MKKVLNSLILVILIGFCKPALSQIDTVFWFAAPWVTVGHASNVPVVLRLSSFSNTTTVRVRQPASTFDTTFTIPPNSLVSESLSHLINQIENTPGNVVLNRGLKITSDFPITVVYEVVTVVNNPETYSLKGQNGMGKEFICPFQTKSDNGNYTPSPRSQIDIIATENNTVVWITPRCNVVGHLAGVTYSINLNIGQTYGIENVTRFTSVAGQNLSGTIIVSNKPISVSVSDDSVQSIGGCRDLMGDQIVPVEVIGTQYVINKGGLNTGEYEGAYVVATQNFTKLTINDGVITNVLLNKGDTYFYTATNPLTYITGDKPIYVIHTSGFGCEMGEAIIPPLNCAGSDQVSFTRTNTQTFILNILCKTIATGNFSLNGNTTLVPASSFTIVPGTGNIWSGAQITFSTSQIPVGITNLLKNTNATDNLFSMGVINGGSNSGCLYHYMSSFLRRVYTNAGIDKNICTASNTISLTGSVTGGATTGIWTTIGGTGTFGNITNLSTTYTLSANDLNQSQIKFVLSSTGNCTPVLDTLILNIFPSPKVDAGNGVTLCTNNISLITLNGTLQYAAGANWTSSGTGSFGNTGALITTYLPSIGDLTKDSITIKLTSTGSLNGCQNKSDSLKIYFIKSPKVSVSPDISVCANNATVAISGSVTIGSTTGIWSGGQGTYIPGITSLTITYIPTPLEITTGSVNLVLTSTNNGKCNQVKDSVLITFTKSPSVNAGADFISCKNNPSVILSGVVGGPTTTGIWSGGTGTFTPSNSVLNSIYNPSPTEIAAGSMTLTLSSTNNANCNQSKDDVVIKFTNPPTVNAGLDLTVCKNNVSTPLLGIIAGPTTTGIWSGGAGTYNPSNTVLNATYTPSSSEITAGFVNIYLTSTNNGNCKQVIDTVKILMTNAPSVSAGSDIFSCANNINTILTGTISGPTSTGVWSGGAGTFNPGNSTLTTTYTPTQSEVNAGMVILTLTSTNNGNCKQVIDSVIINFSTSPSVNSGSNIIICKNNAIAVLSGSVTGGASTGIWTGGTGTYNPSNLALNTLYTPSAAEIAAGSVTLTLSSTNNGNCKQVIDSIVITISNSPIVNAGLDLTPCKNNASFVLSGIVSGPTTTGIWTGGTGSYNPSNSVLNATYTPSSSELNAGFVYLYLMSTNNGGCKQTVDTVKISFTGSPIVNIGPDLSICANNPTVAINGTVSIGSTTGIWSGSGSGLFSPSTTSLNTIYYLSPSDIASGSIKIKLTSTNNGKCKFVSDSLIISVTQSPIVDAGINDTICSSNIFVPINGNVTGGANTNVWTTLSNGLFGNANNLSTIYTLSNSDILAGQVTLVLTSTSGNCLPVSDTVHITIVKAPLVNSGNDKTVCDNQLVTLNGNITGITNTGKWITLGTGQFIPNDSILSTSYQPSAIDIANGFVQIVLFSSHSKGCVDASDTIKITFKSSPKADFTGNNFCFKKSIPFIDNSTIITGSITGWLWNFGDNNTSGATNPVHTYTNPGTYIVTLIVNGSNGCFDSVKKPVTIYFLPKSFFFNNTPCIGNKTLFVDSSKSTSGNIMSWNWNFGDNISSTNQNPIHVFGSAQSYTVSLIVTSIYGCKDTSKKVVTVIPSPIANFSVNPNPVEALEIAQFTDLSTSPTLITNWFWTFGDATASNLQNPQHSFNAQGDYNVYLVVKDVNGCVDTARKDINVILLPDVPTAFTPNGDGQNDFFLVRGGPFKNINVRVYNNWGQLIFETNDQLDGWNGTFKGEIQPIGVFVWVVEVEMQTGKKIKKTGDVTLLR